MNQKSYKVTHPVKREDIDIISGTKTMLMVHFKRT